MKSVAIMLLATLSCTAACGGSVEQTCDQRSGTYQAHFSERPGGTCGAMSDQTLTIDPNLPDVSPSCTGKATYTPDHCDETLHLTCPSGLGALQSVGTTAWSRNAAEGIATLRYVYLTAAGSETCESTYDITYVRIQR